MTGIPPSQHKAVQLAAQVVREDPLYLDTETTGTGKSDEIVEISILDSDGQILLDTLVRPSQPIPPDSIAIHGITDEMVRGAPLWPAIWPTVRSLLAGRLIAIYNAEFDLRMMQQSHNRYRLPWRESLRSFCIMKLYAEYRGEWDMKRRAYRYHSLETAGRHMSIALPNSHRSAADTLLARQLLHAIAATSPTT